MTDSDDARRAPEASSDDSETAQPQDGETDTRPDRAHLEGIDDGCGCAEVWEHLSDQRERARQAGDD